MSAYRSASFRRSLTLLRTFLVASAAILAVGAVSLSSTLSGSMRSSALQGTARDFARYTHVVVAPNAVHGRQVAVSSAARQRLARAIERTADVKRLSVFTSGGRLVFSTETGARSSRRPSMELRDVMHSGVPTASFVETGRAGGGHALHVRTALEGPDGRLVGGVDALLDGRAAEAAVADTSRTIWIAIGLVFGLLWLALAVLVKSASHRLRRQNEELAETSHELRDSARELEETLLETIETLNAAVEARDPYTAGHSQRVRRVSLAIGRELSLSPKQLGALSTAALFHDIGKIGMPDSILTKPDILTRAEAAVMREHVVRSAEIVGRISSLRESVPAIRHHHERWDGLGYPDGLAGEEIPVEAAIIAIADAWDAMTTERPYAVALDLDDALAQVRLGRGMQFSPATVDAFLAIARRRPAEILPPEVATASVAAVV